MSPTIISVTVPHATIERVQATSRIVRDENTGRRIGWIDIVRGFALYRGENEHDGFTCTIAGGVEGLVRELAKGVRNGRDDRS